MPDHFPGSGLFGWLGRQIGYVTKAVKADVLAPRATVYRASRIEEVAMPHDKTVRLRRTTIDEVIVQNNRSSIPGGDKI